MGWHHLARKNISSYCECNIQFTVVYYHVRRVFIPFQDKHYPNETTFEQDNALDYSGKHMRECFISQGRVDVPSTARTPEMSYIENPSSELSSRLYDCVLRFSSYQHLK